MSDIEGKRKKIHCHALSQEKLKFNEQLINFYEVQNQELIKMLELKDEQLKQCMKLLENAIALAKLSPSESSNSSVNVSNNIVVDNNAMSESENQTKNSHVEMNFNAPVTAATGVNEGVININVSEQQKTLSESSEIIQRLLKQLEKTNPSATVSEQIAYVNVAITQDLKQRAIGALKGGGEVAIEEFFLENKYLKVGKAIIKGWLQGSN